MSFVGPLAPPLVLLLFGMGLLLLDALTRWKEIVPPAAVAGLVLAALLNIPVAVDPAYHGQGFNGAITVDEFSALFNFLFVGATFLVVLASAGYQRRLAASLGEYYALLLLVCAAMMFLASASDLIAVYI